MQLYLTKKKILFVCTMNIQRSKTAEELYKTDERFIVKSAGTDKFANIQISQENLEWSDFIMVMEKHHRSKIRSEFPEIYNDKRIICLYIEDEYDFMEEYLIHLLKRKFEFIYNQDIK